MEGSRDLPATFSTISEQSVDEKCVTFIYANSHLENPFLSLSSLFTDFPATCL